MRFLLKPLSYHISPANCRIQVKSNSITVTLKKEENGHWIDLTKKSGLASATGGGSSSGKKDKGLGGLEDGNDAQASLMKMMKNLYDTGDDDMKRTINESWAKA